MAGIASQAAPQYGARTGQKFGGVEMTCELRKLVLLAIATAMICAGGAQAWDFEVKRDDFGTEVFASTYFVEGSGTTDSAEKAGTAPEYFGLTVRCQERTLEAFVIHDGMFDPLAIDIYPDTALLRFGTRPSARWPIGIATNGNGVFLHDTAKAIRALTNVDRLAIRVTGRRAYTAKFRVGGLKQYRAKFAKAGCPF